MGQKEERKREETNKDKQTNKHEKTKHDILETLNEEKAKENEMDKNADPEFSETYKSELTMTATKDVIDDDIFDEPSRRKSISWIKRYQESMAQDLSAQKIKNQEKERLRQMREQLRLAN